MLAKNPQSWLAQRVTRRGAGAWRYAYTYSWTLFEPTRSRVRGARGRVGVRARAGAAERAGGRVAHTGPKGRGPRLAPHAADAALQGVVEAAAEQGGAPATPRCARGPDPAAAVEHLEPLRTRIAARIRMQRDEERGPVARHGDAPLDRDEGGVGAG